MLTSKGTSGSGTLWQDAHINIKDHMRNNLRHSPLRQHFNSIKSSPLRQFCSPSKHLYSLPYPILIQLLIPPNMPRLHEDLPTPSMHRVHNFLPRYGVLLTAQYRRKRPGGLEWTNEDPFGDYEPGCGPLRVVFHADRAGFEVVDVTVAGQGAHCYTVAKVEGKAYNCRLKEGRHDDGLRFGGHDA
jgi:hypothetical protein